MATALDVMQYLQKLESRIEALENQPRGKRVACGDGAFQGEDSHREILLDFEPTKVAVFGATYGIKEKKVLVLTKSVHSSFIWVAHE